MNSTHYSAFGAVARNKGVADLTPRGQHFDESRANGTRHSARYEVTQVTVWPAETDVWGGSPPLTREGGFEQNFRPCSMERSGRTQNQRAPDRRSAGGGAGRVLRGPRALVQASAQSAVATSRSTGETPFASTVNSYRSCDRRSKMTAAAGLQRLESRCLRGPATASALTLQATVIATVSGDDPKGVGHHLGAGRFERHGRVRGGFRGPTITSSIGVRA